jgi:hypothetical protein
MKVTSMRESELKAFLSNRAASAAECLDRFVSVTHCDPGQDAVTDLITNLGHYADRHGLDYPMLLRRGIAHWLSEQTDPESITAPQVEVYGDGIEITSNPNTEVQPNQTKAMR